MTVYFAQSFSLQLYKSNEELQEAEKKLPNAQYRYFINHNEISFISTSLEKIRDWVKSDACDWIEGCYFTHSVIYKMEEGYCSEPEIIEFYDIDDLDSPSKNWRLEKNDEFGIESYIYKNMKGQEIAFEGFFGIGESGSGFKDDFTLVGDEDREDEIIFVDPNTGEEMFGFYTSFNDEEDTDLN